MGIQIIYFLYLILISSLNILGLARVCYSDSDIILLDDPISAVDNNVGYD